MQWKNRKNKNIVSKKSENAVSDKENENAVNKKMDGCENAVNE